MILVRVVGVCDNCAREAPLRDFRLLEGAVNVHAESMPNGWRRGEPVYRQRGEWSEPVLGEIYCSARCAREALAAK